MGTNYNERIFYELSYSLFAGLSVLSNCLLVYLLNKLNEQLY